MKQETVEIQKELFDQKKSALKKYQELIIGQKGLWKLIKYELIITLFSWVPGALGLVLRMKLYPTLLGRVGRNVTFGQNVVLRHPHKIEQRGAGRQGTGQPGHQDRQRRFHRQEHHLQLQERRYCAGRQRQLWSQLPDILCQ